MTIVSVSLFLTIFFEGTSVLDSLTIMHLQVTVIQSSVHQL